MKKSIFKTVLLLIAVALVGLAIATSCEKEKNGNSDGQGTNPLVVQTDTTNVGTNSSVALVLTADSIHKLLVGSWQEKHYGIHHYYSDDDLRDTLTFHGNDTTVIDKTGIFTNCNFSVLNSNTIAFYKDTVLFAHPFNFSLSMDTTTNEYEIIFHNFINLCMTTDVKNITYKKIK
ncbi:MAG: hypothetical protein IK032_01125 [Bacteroidales bacterium]|nr:hypothetical protein [Bacteroidales bacterium]MBR5029330.1 hypothetical protein [Bacteroidales bacterium]